MSDTSKQGVVSKIAEIVTTVLTAENVRTYVLGTKKNGKPRAIYDIIKTETDKKKKKKKKKKQDSTYSLFLSSKKKKKKKNKKNKDKYWKFD